MNNLRESQSSDKRRHQTNEKSYRTKSLQKSISNLKVSHFAVAQFTTGVITQLNIPLTLQVVNKMRILFKDGIENILVKGKWVRVREYLLQFC